MFLWIGRGQRIEEELSLLRSDINILIDVLTEVEETEMATWEDLKATVATKDTVDESFKAFADGLKVQLADLQTQPGGPTSADLQAMIDDLNTHGQSFADAMTANTGPADGSAADAAV